MTSGHVLMTLALACLASLDIAHAWGFPRWNNQAPRQYMNYYQRAHMRRAGEWGCVHSGEECSSDNKCCSSRDTCVTKYHDNKHMSATCQDLSDVLSPSERKGEGESCKTSHECADLCCRELYAHRQGRRLRCGRQDENDVIYHNCV